MTLGSDGSGDERYVAYLPFELSPWHRIAEHGVDWLSEPAVHTMGPRSLRVEQLHDRYAISLGPFATTLEAAAALQRLRAGLLWVSLKQHWGLRYPGDLSEVLFYSAPHPISLAPSIADLARRVGWSATDGSYQADQAVVRPEHRRLLRLGSGPVSGDVPLVPAIFFYQIEQALQFPAVDRVASDRKLMLAIELFAGFRFELGKTSQFIMLVTALEALCPDTEISEDAKMAVARIRAQVKAQRDKYARESSSHKDLERLLSRIGQLKREAIGTSLRSFVASVIGRQPALGNVTEISRSLDAAYDARSRLLHTGVWTERDLNRHLRFGISFVPRLLEALYLETAGASPFDDNRR